MMETIERAGCQRTWKVVEPAAVVAARRDADQDSYRQHRCRVEPAGHPGVCVCRYCGQAK
jgi:hypothetical protein